MVVVIPGITGSVLTKDGKDVFGLSVGAGLRALFSGGRSLESLALAAGDGDQEDLGDGIVASRLSPDAHLVPGLWKIDGYGKLMTRLGQLPGVDLHPFPYDWRRDNRVHARRLQRLAEGWLAERRQQDPGARLVLVAHSMGGLIARYYLEVLGGWRDTRMLVTFGTPFRGSLNAVGFLSSGLTRLGGLVDLTEMLRSCTSVYQLLPIYRCIDQGDGTLVRLTDVEIPLPGLDPARVASARAFHREIEEAVTRNRQDADYRERGYELQHVVGAEHPTMQAALAEGGRLRLRPGFGAAGEPDDDLAGDGTVPRVSATPLELDNDATAFFSGTRHASLQNADPVLTHLFRVLTAQDLTPFRGARPAAAVSLDLDDVHAAGEPIRVRVRAHQPTDLRVELTALTLPSTGQPGQFVGAPSRAGAAAAGVEVDGVTDWRPVALPPQPPGCYRVTVSGFGGVEPASDLLVVAPAGSSEAVQASRAR